MNPTNPSHSKVKHIPLNQHKAAAGLASLANVVAAGNQSTAVQADPVAKTALGVLQAAVSQGQQALNNKLAAIQAHQTAIKALKIHFGAAGDALRSYEAAINILADGDGSVINQAGLLARAEKTPAAALGEVTVVHSKLGKAATEAIVYWPTVPGATSYAIEVNFTPSNPTGPFTALGSGTSRRRTITAPAPGAQFLCRVAAARSDGSQSAWSAPILVTAR
jgi:hypothetical protein